MPVGWKTVLLAAVAGLGLRLFFIFKFPASAGDTAIYDELARNWLDRQVYGLVIDGRLTPVAHRLPGYPAFLAAVYAIFGPSARAVMLLQALLDLVTCVVAAGLAARLVRWCAPAGSASGAPMPSTEAPARRVSTVALWLCALCPFTADYTSVVLTETLATFLTTLAIALVLEAFYREECPPASLPPPPESSPELPGMPAVERGRPVRPGAADVPSAHRLSPASSQLWLSAGLVTGLATLVRPESPLLLLSIGLTLAFRWRRWGRPPGVAPSGRTRQTWRSAPLFRAGAWLALGLILPLVPWAARNWATFHRVQFLAPRYAELPGEFVPRGFYQWTGTWLVRFPDVYNTVWNVESDKIDIDVLPPSAFDSEEERERVAALLDRYNESLNYTPELDREFGKLASERAARHPLRTYLRIPVERAATIWFWPRIELLPFSGHIFPLATEWDQDRADLLTTLGFGLLGIIYAVLALAGAWIARRYPPVWLVVAYLVIRTAFLTRIEAPEPRYLLVAYPCILALAAIAAARSSPSLLGRKQPIGPARL